MPETSILALVEVLAVLLRYCGQSACHICLLQPNALARAGIAHMMGSLKAEAREQAMGVGIHTLSPGMVLTPLLLDGATDRNKAIFNILCEQPETVRRSLPPQPQMSSCDMMT